MAKRIQFAQHGGPEVLTLVDFEPKAPAPGNVLVRNHAIGLNFIDTYFRSGLYAPPALPSGLGTEGAGVVEAVGEGGHVLAASDAPVQPGARGRLAQVPRATPPSTPSSRS